MAEELKALEDNNTWTVVSLPPSMYVISYRWVYKVNYKLDETIEHYKALLVAKCYTQQAGIDFIDTFLLVANITTLRLLLSIAAIQNWHFLQTDVNNAFLNKDLFEEVYMDLPMGYHIEGENLACRLSKSIYGLGQTSRQWFHKFLKALISVGFTQSKCDYFLFHIDLIHLLFSY